MRGSQLVADGRQNTASRPFNSLDRAVRENSPRPLQKGSV